MLFALIIISTKTNIMASIKNIKTNLKDKTLMSRSNEITRKLLDGKININTICVMVKDFQYKYLAIKDEYGEGDILDAFTPEIWWKLSKTDDGAFRIARKSQV